ncbi:MAG: hypothetical protein ABI823_01740 [Bryobacteraceae bacterium]
MIRTVLTLVASSAMFVQAQSSADLFHKAPPEVDLALRERVTLFYQAHVDSKWRQADKVVAEDSKDQFFAMSKPVYKKFEILKISYSDDFNRANVVTVVERNMNLRGNDFAVKAPVTTEWKIEDGQWFWYVDPKTIGHGASPMGPVESGPATGARPAGMPTDFSQMINDPKRRAELAAGVMNKVTIAKSDFAFAMDEPRSDSALISNHLDGAIQLSYSQDKKVEGLFVDLDKQLVPAGAEAAVRFRFEPTKETLPAVVKINVEVQPTGQIFPIEVRVGTPATAKN